jgi:hypothetical protein
MILYSVLAFFTVGYEEIWNNEIKNKETDLNFHYQIITVQLYKLS